MNDKQAAVCIGGKYEPRKSARDRVNNVGLYVPECRVRRAVGKVLEANRIRDGRAWRYAHDCVLLSGPRVRRDSDTRLLIADATWGLA